MNSVTRHLPEAYLRAPASHLPKKKPVETPQAQNNNHTDRVIEAEWRPVSGSPHRAANVYQVNAERQTSSASLQGINQPPARVTARYQQMTALEPQAEQQPGTLLDIRV